MRLKIKHRRKSLNLIIVTGTSGTFYSSNHPSNYSNDYEEHYIISVENESKISLVFDYVDIEDHVGCFYDYIAGKMA